MDSRFVREPAREVPVCARCRVAVVGGGVAGIAAALSAARAGADTVLLEREYAPGGLATLGLVSLYLPLCDGRGRQVSFGIAEELLRLSLSLDADGAERLRWPERVAGRSGEDLPRYECAFNPSAFAILTERLLLDAGVRILYGTQVCGAAVENGRVEALLTESRSGRRAVAAESVVDASGDAVVCALAGERTAVLRQKNILAAWYSAAEAGGLRLRPLGACDKPDKYKTGGEEPPIGGRRYEGLTCEEATAFSEDAHRALLDDFLRGGPLAAGHQLAAIASIPQLRMTRRLAGISEPAEPDGPLRREDSVGMIGDWKRRGPVYELPLSCLRGARTENLTAAGRCISVRDDFWDDVRVIPACAVTGEAAGLAAALTDRSGAPDAAAVQTALRRRGVPLHESEL